MGRCSGYVVEPAWVMSSNPDIDLWAMSSNPDIDLVQLTVGWPNRTVTSADGTIIIYAIHAQSTILNNSMYYKSPYIYMYLKSLSKQ